MTPPINIDGSTVNAITIDGTSVKEVTVDGSTVFGSIPDSVVQQLDAQELSGFSDGDTISTWTATVGVDGSASGNPTYRDSAINSNAAVEFDGDDFFEVLLGTQTQPFTIIAVSNLDDQTAKRGLSESINTTSSFEFNDNGPDYRIFSGSVVSGNDNTTQLLTGVYDATNSEIYQGDTQTGSGDAGTNDLDDVNVGTVGSAGWLGDIGFWELHDGRPSNGLATRQQQVADAWDITL